MRRAHSRSTCRRRYGHGGAGLLTTLLATGALACARDGTGPATAGTAASLDAAGASTVVVSSSAELAAALSAASVGSRVVVRAGTYPIDAPLTVPDGVTLEGEGLMLFDGAGLPSGFAAATRTTLAMSQNVPGDVLTLGDGATVRRLQIVDLPGRVGNVIGVLSREPGDRVSANIAEVEIVNPNPHGVMPQGPTGCGVVALTLNANLGADPPPHEGATIAARMVRSLIRSPAPVGCGLFAFNFAPLASVSVTLEGDVVGGGIIANGGVSRTDAVHDSRTRIESRGNLYRYDAGDACLAPATGWNLNGGSGAPVPFPIAATERNSLRVHSVDDGIEGFTTGILATGGRRFFPSPIAGPSNDNAIDLQLLGSTIATPSCGGAPFVADFRLAGALVTAEGISPGDGNTVRAVIRGVTGSGPRFNVYADVLGPSGPLPPALAGSGNRLEIVGSPNAFSSTNRWIDPLPGTEFFIGRGP